MTECLLLNENSMRIKLLRFFFYLMLICCNFSSVIPASLSLQKIDTYSAYGVAHDVLIDKNILQSVQQKLADSVNLFTSKQFKTDVQEIIKFSSLAKSHQEMQALIEPVRHRYQVLSSCQGPAHLIESYQAQFKIIDDFKKNFLSLNKNYLVSSNVQTVVGSEATKFETFYGTSIQHVLHAETVDTLNKSAELVVSNASELATKAGVVAVICADKAYELNSIKEIRQGFDWINLGKMILRCGEGAVKGLYKGSFELSAQMFCMALNPVQTATSFVQAAVNVLAHPQESFQKISTYAQTAIDLTRNFDFKKVVKGYLENLEHNPESTSEITVKTLLQFFGHYKFIQPLQTSIQNVFRLSTLAHAITHKFVPKAGKVYEAVKSSSNAVKEEVKLLKVANMKQFFKEFELGQLLAPSSIKTNHQYQGQAIYRLEKKINSFLKKGYCFYLDALHKDHIEIFDYTGRALFVMNLDGTLNIVKSKIVREQQRTIKL